MRQSVVNLEDAADFTNEARAAGRTVVLCHGCFDIVHPGHIRHLQQARQFGDHLIVSVTGDHAVAKGDHRPLIPQELRAENLAALDVVDLAVICPEATAVTALEAIRPGVYVKGREYEHNEDPRFERERELVERYGGKVVFTSGDVVFSSSAIIEGWQRAAHPAHAALWQLVEQHGIDEEAVESAIAAARGKRVLVVGECWLDVDELCDQPNLGEGQAFMSLRPIERRSAPGGAAALARRLASLGMRPTLLSPIGTGDAAHGMRQALELEGVAVTPIRFERPITEIHRIIANGRTVMQLERGRPIVLDRALQEKVVDQATELANDASALVLADAGLGFFTEPMLRSMGERIPSSDSRLRIGLARGQRSNLAAMPALDVLSVTEHQLRQALQEFDEGLTAVVWRLLDQTGARQAIVALGNEGLVAFDRRQVDAGTEGAAAADPAAWPNRLIAEHVPPLSPYAFERHGCDEARAAAALIGLLADRNFPLAALLAAVADSIVGSRLGSVILEPSELRRQTTRLLRSHLACDPSMAGPLSSPVS